MTGAGEAQIAKPIAAHAWAREANEHYVEPAWCSARLFQEEKLVGRIWDPCCGFGTIVKEALKAGHVVNEARRDALTVAEIYRRHAEALAFSDPDFHRPEIDALVEAARIISGRDSA